MMALFIGMVIGLTGQVGAGERLLDSYRWKYRILLICAGSSHDKRTAALDAALESRRKGLQDRDLVIVRAYEDGTGSANGSLLAPDDVRKMRQDFSIGTGECLVLLIGKDGTEKLREGCTFDLEDIFSVIDAMPMRQREMNERNGEGQ